jgi:hypothetical protein
VGVKMKKWIIVVFLFMVPQLIFPQTVKEVEIPKNIKIEESIIKETLIKNLFYEEVYQMGAIYIIDDYIYMTNYRPPEIMKINLEGEFIGKGGRMGQGPGEFQFCKDIRKLNDNIIFMAPYSVRMIIYNKDLKFIREFKVKKQYMGFFVNKRNELIMTTRATPGTLHYFEVISEDGKYLRSFGRRENQPTGETVSFDRATDCIYIPEEDSFWVAMANRYALQYYQNENLEVEIRANKEFFKWVDKEYGNASYKSYLDNSIYLAWSNNRLYHFFRKDEQIFCDIFNTENYQLEKRMKIKNNYSGITHHRDNIFYTIYYDERGDMLLYKLVFQLN